jgi:hypothetical protein
MRIGQPKLSERETQWSGLVVTPTEPQNNVALEFDDLQCKGA